MKETRATNLTIHTKFALTSLLILPLLAGVLWGTHFTEDVYILLRYAQNLANGEGLVYDAVMGFAPAPLTNPLFAAMIGALSKTWFDPLTSAFLLSIAGWMIAGTAIFLIGQQTGWQLASAATVYLLSFNPFIIATLGNAHSWSLATGWMSLALLTRQRRPPYVISAFLFFGLNPYIFSPILMLIWGVYETWHRKKIPVATAIAAMSSILVWGMLSKWQFQWLKLPEMLFIQSTLWIALLFLVGIGAEWAGIQLTEHRLVNLHPKKLQIGLLGISIIILGLAQGRELWSMHRERPLNQWRLESEMASWLRTKTPSAASLFASEKVGYLAGQPTVSPSTFSAPLDAQSLQKILQTSPIDHLISPNDILWQNLAAAPWFRLSYTPVRQFEAPYAPTTPYTVWAYRPSLDGWSERQAVNIKAPDRLDIIGYQFKSQHIQPGKNLQIMLYLQTPEALIEPPTSFQVLVRLVSPIDSSSLLEWEELLPLSLDAANWRPGQLILEQIEIPIPTQFKIGAYRVNISLSDVNGGGLWSLSRDNDINPLDRFSLGFVSVPWHGSLDNIQPQTAMIGGQIKLLGFVHSEPQQGDSLSISLYWQALQSIDENYVVFVHILDRTGQLVASQDAVPLNGRYPTTAWHANDIIPDEHIIPLPIDLPVGEFQIKVGMYLPETGERVLAADDDGIPLQNNAVFLTDFTIP